MVNESCKKSYLQFKYLQHGNRQKEVDDFCQLIISQYTDIFPDFSTLASILLTCPLTSVPCERGFSLQNRHHNSVSSSRSTENVECRMFIEYGSKDDYSNCGIKNNVMEKAAGRFLQNRK